MFRFLPALLAILPISAIAADQSIDLEPVMVSGSTLEESLPVELSTYGIELQIIDREQLDRTGISDVGQALQGSVPGLFLSPKTGRGDYVDIALQGSRSEDVLWLVNGVRINNRLFGGTSPLDSISTHMIERIEVLKGGQGLFYGTQAVAGVINIVLRPPGGDERGSLTGAVGTLGDQRLAGHVRGQGDVGRWLVFAEQDQSDGYRPYRDSAYQDNARRVDRGFNRRSVGGRYHLPLNEEQSFNMLLLRNDVVADYPRPVDNFKSFNDRTEHIVSLKWDSRLTDRTGYFIKAYWHDWWTDYTRLGLNDDGTPRIINDRDQWGYEDYGINLLGHHVTEGGSRILAGIDYQRYEGEDFVLRIDGKAEAVTAGFVQYRPHLTFSPETHLALGARYNQAEFGGSHSVWDMSVSQPLVANLTLDASLGSNFRLPSAFELFVIDDAFPAGNEDLSPEHSRNANVSLNGAVGVDTTWRLGGFYREIEDLISVSGGTYVNSESRVRIRGGEAELSFGGNLGWQLDLNATWAKARENGTDRQVDDIPEWFINAHLTWEGSDQGWQLEARHTGPRRTTLADFGSQPYGDFTVFDASAWWRFGHRGNHRFTLRIENLTDRLYASGVSQGQAPNGGSFRYETLGPPRNAQLEYGRRF